MKSNREENYRTTNKQEVNFKLEHENYIQANSNNITGRKKFFFYLLIIYLDLEMRSGKGARFCDDTGLGFNPCSFIHGL